MENYLKPWRQYASFSGRASRAEYWTFILVNLVIQIGGVVLLPSRFKALLIVFYLLSFLPTIAVAVRRLHDTNKSGAYWFYGLLPIVGPFILLVFTLQEGTNGANTYGPDSREKKEQFITGL